MKTPKQKECFNKSYFKKIFTRLLQERYEIANTRLTLLKRFKSPITNLLDIGCGYGDFLSVCEKAGIKTYGTDISKEAIEYAKSFVPQAHLQRNNAFNQKLPFEDKYFDVVTCFDVLEHLEKVDLPFSEIYRVLNNEGIFFLITPPVTKLGKLINQFVPDDKTHINRQSISYWENELLKHGFKIKTRKYAFLFGFPPTSMLRERFRRLNLPVYTNPYFSPFRSICSVFYLIAQKQ